MKQQLSPEQLKLVSGGAAEGRYEVYREVYYDGDDESFGHGYYYIEYSDGSSERVYF